MKPETLKKVVELSSRVNCVLVATADAKGLPHVTAAGMLTMTPDGRVAVIRVDKALDDVVMAYRRPSSLPIIKPRVIETGLAAN